MNSKVLVPVNDSDTTRKTIASILEYRHRFDTELTLLHVVDLDKMAYRMIPDFQIDMVRQRATEAGEKLLEKKAAMLREAGLTVVTRMETGSPRQVITRIANQEDFRLLVTGRKGKGEIRDVLFGSVANYVLHNVSCPVLLF